MLFCYFQRLIKSSVEWTITHPTWNPMLLLQIGDFRIRSSFRVLGTKISSRFLKWKYSKEKINWKTFFIAKSRVVGWILPGLTRDRCSNPRKAFEFITTFKFMEIFFPSPFVTRNWFCRHRNLDQVIFRVYFPFKKWSYNCIDSIPSNDELWQVFYCITFAGELWEDEEKDMKQYSNCSRYQRIFNISFKNYKWLITRWDCIENV